MSPGPVMSSPPSPLARHDFVVDRESRGGRLDIFLQRKLSSFSRAYCQKLIREKQATVNGEPAKPSLALHEGDRVRVEIPPLQSLEAQPEEIALDVLFEDESLLVINKLPGMVVHPAAGNREHTLVNALLHHCRGSLSGIGGVTRPGIVHRLDKDTSGCLVVAKTDAAHRALVEQFQGRDVWKEYLALVWGLVTKSHGRIDAPIGRNPRNRQKMAAHIRGGKPALTEFELVERFAECSAVRVQLHTGRTHQIRVHFASLGHPVVGDAMYGRKRQSGLDGIAVRQMLHAHRLGFEHPRTKCPLEFTAPVPTDMRELIRRLREAQSGNRSAMTRSTADTSTSLNPRR